VCLALGLQMALPDTLIHSSLGSYISISWREMKWWMSGSS
jgi:hypothetical protein